MDQGVLVKHGLDDDEKFCSQFNVFHYSHHACSFNRYHAVVRPNIIVSFVQQKEWLADCSMHGIFLTLLSWMISSNGGGQCCDCDQTVYDLRQR